MSTRKISLVAILCLVAPMCYAGGVRIPRPVKGSTLVHIPRVAKFRNPVRTVSTKPTSALTFARNRAFLRKDRMLQVVENYRNEALVDLLANRLRPYENNIQAPKVNVAFSGHFFPSKKAMARETQRFTKPSFQVGPKQAVYDMLVQAARSDYGYGVIKVYETMPGAAEPRMSMLVLDAEKMEWMEYSAPKTIPADKPAPALPQTAEPAPEVAQPAVENTMLQTVPKPVHRAQEAPAPQAADNPRPSAYVIKIRNGHQYREPVYPPTVPNTKPKFYIIKIRNGVQYREAVY